MKKISRLITILVFFLFFLLSSFSFCSAEDVQILTDSEYYPAVLDGVKGAKSSIYILMPAIEVKAEKQGDPIYDLVDALVQASKSRVFVQVVLEDADADKSRRADEILSEGKVRVSYDESGENLADRIIVIDREKCILGSHDFSKSSLHGLGDRETSVAIISKDIADELIKKINNIRMSQPNFIPESRRIKVPATFLLGTNKPADELFDDNEEKLFDLYLSLLRQSAILKSTKFRPDHKKILLDLDLPQEIEEDEDASYYKGIMSSLLVDLDTDYRIISYDGQSDIVDLRLEGISNFIMLPMEYFDSGWDNRLSFGAKYFYLINLHEQRNAGRLPYWKMSVAEIADKYATEEKVVTDASKELSKFGILIVESASDGSGQNKYFLKELYSPEYIKQEIDFLKNQLGTSNVNHAVKFAEEIGQPHNLRAIRMYVDLIKKYGFEKVKSANAEVAKFSFGDPRRSINYAVHLLAK